MSTEPTTTRADAEADLRAEITATLLATGLDTPALPTVTAALMRVVARHQEPPVWTESLIKDVATAAARKLRADGIPASRDKVTEALAAAGIAPERTR